MKDVPVFICAGRFEVWDRGDRFAEISTVGGTRTISEQDARAYYEQDLAFGREPIRWPANITVPSSEIVGLIEATRFDENEPYPECAIGSAFPGALRLCSSWMIGGEREIDVADIEELQAVMAVAVKAPVDLEN